MFTFELIAGWDVTLLLGNRKLLGKLLAVSQISPSLLNRIFCVKMCFNLGSGVARGGWSSQSWREARPFGNIPGAGSKTEPYWSVLLSPLGVAMRGGGSLQDGLLRPPSSYATTLGNREGGRRKAMDSGFL